MKKLVSITQMILLMGAFATGLLASPITYGISFSASSGLLPTSGQFTYDAALPTVNMRFTNFIVNWDGIAFDLTSVANSGGVVVGSACGSSSTAATVFAFLTGSGQCSNPNNIGWTASLTSSSGLFTFTDSTNGVGPPSVSISANASSNSSNASGAGTFTSAVPEPSTLVLSLASGAFALLLRRRSVS